jgi:mannose-6-phosphate isomerase class I
LSVQVHPSNAYALKNENSFGKTEMWYIVEAEEGAGIYLGFNRDITKEEYKEAIQNNTLTQILNFYPVKAGECYFIPSGTVHAIGAGCLIYEIQQNSNLTYRVYDYGRGREVHIEKALAVSNLSKHQNISLSGDLLGVSKYFTVSKLNVCDNTLKTDASTFNCVTVVGGSGEVDGIAVKKGDSLFVPANYGSYRLKGDMQIILTQIRKYYLQFEFGKSAVNCAIVDDNQKVILEKDIPIDSELDVQKIACEIACVCNELLKNTNMSANDLAGIKTNEKEIGEQANLIISEIRKKLF